MDISTLRVRQLFLMHAREFRRDFGAIFFSFVFPLFFVAVLVISSVMSPTFTFEFGLVDRDSNPSARKLVQALASDYMSVRSLDRSQAEAQLKEGKLQAVLVLPAEDLEAGGEIELVVGQRYEGFASIAMEAALSRIDDTRATAPHYRFHTVAPKDEASSDFTFMFPGMLAMALLQLGLFATATPLLRARERGTLRHLLLTPLNISELLASQVAFRLLVAVAQVALILVAGMLAVDLDFARWMEVLGVALLGATMLICIGYALAGLAPNLESGMAVIMIANFSMLFGGNIFSDPSGSTGLWVIAHFLPVSYLADAFRQVINQSAGLWPLWVDLCVLLAWSAGALLVASRTFRFDMSSQERRGIAVAS